MVVKGNFYSCTHGIVRLETRYSDECEVFCLEGFYRTWVPIDELQELSQETKDAILTEIDNFNKRISKFNPHGISCS